MFKMAISASKSKKPQELMNYFEFSLLFFLDRIVLPV